MVLGGATQLKEDLRVKHKAPERETLPRGAGQKRIITKLGESPLTTQGETTMKAVATVLLCLFAIAGNAAQWRTDPLTPLDRQYMEQRQQELNSLAQMSMGRSFGHGRDSDLRLIQEILDRKLVKKDEIAKLQAMGIIMGEHLRRENGLRWVIYVDAKGRSRALEVPAKDEFLFPVTQISSRVIVDADVDVKAIYQRLEKEITEIKKKIIVR